MTTRTDEHKLRVLLPHWIEHNAEHAAEFDLWAARTRAAGHKETADRIAAAATQLQAVNDTLAEALEALG